MSDTRQVVVAITRKVKPGREEEFESALEEFFSNVHGEPSTEGQFYMRPASKDGSTYGILRAFKSASDREAFYRSEAFQRWLRTVEPLVDTVEPGRKSLLYAGQRFDHNGLPCRSRQYVPRSPKCAYTRSPSVTGVSDA